MHTLKWGCGGGATLLLVLCLSLTLVPLAGCGALQMTFVPAPPGGDGDYDPPPATCANAGIAYPDNPFQGWPMAGRSWDDVNYYYCAADYEQEFGRTHWGIDIDAWFREPVYATAEALVVRAAEDPTYGMGRNVKLCTPAGWCAVYMHLDEWVVSVGQAVAPGTLLGYADSTGFSTGHHLHYQINDPSGTPVDPAPTFLTNPVATLER